MLQRKAPAFQRPTTVVCNGASQLGLDCAKILRRSLTKHTTLRRVQGRTHSVESNAHQYLPTWILRDRVDELNGVQMLVVDLVV